MSTGTPNNLRGKQNNSVTPPVQGETQIPQPNPAVQGANLAVQPSPPVSNPAVQSANLAVQATNPPELATQLTSSGEQAVQDEPPAPPASQPTSSGELLSLPDTPPGQNTSSQQATPPASVSPAPQPNPKRTSQVNTQRSPVQSGTFVSGSAFIDPNTSAAAAAEAQAEEIVKKQEKEEQKQLAAAQNETSSIPVTSSAASLSGTAQQKQKTSHGAAKQQAIEDDPGLGKPVKEENEEQEASDDNEKEEEASGEKEEDEDEASGDKEKDGNGSVDKSDALTEAEINNPETHTKIHYLTILHRMTKPNQLELSTPNDNDIYKKFSLLVDNAEGTRDFVLTNMGYIHADGGGLLGRFRKKEDDDYDDEDEPKKKKGFFGFRKNKEDTDDDYEDEPKKKRGFFGFRKNKEEDDDGEEENDDKDVGKPLNKHPYIKQMDTFFKAKNKFFGKKSGGGLMNSLKNLKNKVLGLKCDDKFVNKLKNSIDSNDFKSRYMKFKHPGFKEANLYFEGFIDFITKPDVNCKVLSELYVETKEKYIKGEAPASTEETQGEQDEQPQEDPNGQPPAGKKDEEPKKGGAPLKIMYKDRFYTIRTSANNKSFISSKREGILTIDQVMSWHMNSEF